MTLIGELTIFRFDGQVVPDVMEISGPEMSVAEVERTPLGATAKRFRPSKVTEAGTVDVTIYYNPANAQHAAILAAAQVPSTANCEIEWSDGTKAAFAAFVTAANFTGGEQEAEVLLEVSLRIDGAVTIT
jgi:hypothetical protein